MRTQAAPPERHCPLTPTPPGSGYSQQAKSCGLSEMERTPGSIWGSQWKHFRWNGSLRGRIVHSFAGHLPSWLPGPNGSIITVDKQNLPLPLHF